MRENKERVFAFTYKEEGGYSNDAHDPGGATNYGIIQTEYNGYRATKALAPQSVRYITKAEADEIYTMYYWNKVHGDDLPGGIDLVVYDYAVNSGVSRAVKYMQRLLKVTVDGKLGPITLAAAQAVDAKDFIISFDSARLSFLQSLSIWQYFGKGWAARVRRATTTALQLMGHDPVVLVQKEAPKMPEILLGIVRHLITGSGAVAAATAGFDIHNPVSWFGVMSFAGGTLWSAIDKSQKAGHLDAMTVLTNAIIELNTRLDAQTPTKVG
jgi:lysozyme family protein